MNPLTFSTQTLSLRLGWTLLYSLWQGALIAALLAFALPLLQGAQRLRYACAVAAMALLPLSACLTFATLNLPDNSTSHAVPIHLLPQNLTAANPLTNPAGALISTASPAPVSLWARAQQRITSLLPILAGIWAIGAAALSLWQLLDWLALERLRAGSVPCTDVSLLAAASRLSSRLRITRAVKLSLTSRIDTPLIIGWIKPVILLPPAMLSGLSMMQLENILAHELAHVRRCDYLVNVLQVLVETLLFYHPAAWWIGSRIRLEREQCCDDIAVAVCGDRYRYVESLTLLEELRGSHPLALAAGGSDRGHLLLRVRRLLRSPEPRPRINRRALTSLAILFALCLTGLLQPSHAADLASPTTPPTTLRAVKGQQFLIKCVVVQHNARGSISQLDESNVLARPYFVVEQDNECTMNLDWESAPKADVHEKQNTRLGVTVSTLPDGHLQVALKYRQTHLVLDGNQTTHDMGVETIQTVMPEQPFQLDAGDGVEVTATIKPLPKGAATQPQDNSSPSHAGSDLDRKVSTQVAIDTFIAQFVWLNEQTTSLLATINDVATAHAATAPLNLAIAQYQRLEKKIAAIDAADQSPPTGVLAKALASSRAAQWAEIQRIHNNPALAKILDPLLEQIVNPRGAAEKPATEPAIAPEVQARVDAEIAMARQAGDVISTERVQLDDNQQGWLITYRVIEQSFTGPRLETHWLKLGSQGYVAAMSPIQL